MSNWSPDRHCPDCGRVVRRLVPPAGLGELAGMMPELFHCPECVVRVELPGEVAECPKLLFEGADGTLQVAPDVSQWMMMNESWGPEGDDGPSG